MPRAVLSIPFSLLAISSLAGCNEPPPTAQTIADQHRVAARLTRCRRGSDPRTYRDGQQIEVTGTIVNLQVEVDEAIKRLGHDIVSPMTDVIPVEGVPVALPGPAPEGAREPSSDLRQAIEQSALRNQPKPAPVVRSVEPQPDRHAEAWAWAEKMKAARYPK